jgi:hypothetical protein
MSRRSTEHAPVQATPEVLADAVAPDASADETPVAPAQPGRRRPPAGLRRPALLLAVAAAGGIMVNVLLAGQPDADAQPAADQPVSVADQLGLSSQQTDAALTDGEVGERLGDLAANRSQRETEEAAAAQAQAAADQATRDAQAAAAAQAAAEAKAAEEAAAKAAAEQAAAAQAAAEQAAAEQAAAQAAAQAQAEAAKPAPAASSRASSSGSGSFQDYALAQLGGDSGEFSCLENLWGKESGWNPNAQNPSSTAYGIPQFLNSTWAGTGIAKTSDGYRQIDAGLIYIDSRYGSPCGAWSHSKSTGWY